MKSFFYIAIIALLAGCADTHQLMRTGNTLVNLDSSKSTYVALSRDGRYGQTIYQGSGVSLSQGIMMAFAPYSNSVETGYEYQSFDAALAYTKEHNYGYLVIPAILEWEDRATEWSGIPDKASIKITIIEVSSGKTLDSAIIKGKSGLATFGGDHPQDLLQKPVGQYVGSLY